MGESWWGQLVRVDISSPTYMRGPGAVTGAFALGASRCEVWVPGQWSMNLIAVDANSWWYWKIAPWPESG
jgi:hypothetical protein